MPKKNASLERGFERFGTCFELVVVDVFVFCWEYCLGILNASRCINPLDSQGSKRRCGYVLLVRDVAPRCS